MRTLSLFLLLALIAYIYVVTTYGFHGAVKQYILDKASSGDFVIKAEGVKVGLAEGLIFNRVKLYRKSVIGDAAIEARRVVLIPDLSSFLRGRLDVDLVVLNSVNIRPELMSRAVPEDGETPQTEPMSWSSRCRVEVNECKVSGLNITHMRMEVIGYGDRLLVKDIAGSLEEMEPFRTGAFNGKIEFDSVARVTTGTIRTRLDPGMLLPLIQANRMMFTEVLTRRFEFRQNMPDIEVSFSSLSGTNGFFKLNGRFTGDDFSYLGVANKRTDGKILIDYSRTNSIVVLEPLTISRTEGIFSGNITVDTGHSTVAFNAMSTIEPKSLFRMIGIFSEDQMRCFAFGGPVNITAVGLADYGGMTNTSFDADVSARNMSLWKFKMDECAFKMKMRGYTNEIHDVKARVCDGILQGMASFYVPTQKNARIRYDISGQATDLASSALQNTLLDITDANNHGKISATFGLQGEIGEGASSGVKGAGDIKVKGGKIFRMPVFGPLSSYMAKLMPGLDFIVAQTDAKADVTIADGKVSSKAIYIDGDVISIKGEGAYGFDGELDYYAQVTLMKENTLLAKLLRTVTYPISKLFEFRVKGTFDDAVWYPVNFSRDLLEKLGLKEEKKKE